MIFADERLMASSDAATRFGRRCKPPGGDVYQFAGRLATHPEFLQAYGTKGPDGKPVMQVRELTVEIPVDGRP
ncbi:hypothetical protein [Paraburkholderia kururiensis]